MSNMICQDPIEKFFGQQRQRGGAHENPTVAEFIKNTQALHVINTTCDNIQGNNTKRPLLDEENTTCSMPLTKRRRKH